MLEPGVQDVVERERAEEVLEAGLLDDRGEDAVPDERHPFVGLRSACFEANRRERRFRGSSLRCQGLTDQDSESQPLNVVGHVLVPSRAHVAWWLRSCCAKGPA